MPDDPLPLPAAPVHRLGNHQVPEDWAVGAEPRQTFKAKLTDGFFARYASGDVVLDIGYRGGVPDAKPIFPHAVGVELDYPGYDGKTLPFADGSVDTVYSSHMLEHTSDPIAIVRDWYRVLRTGGFIVCMVPHQFLYEKRWHLPSRWNEDHKRFYTPARLLGEFEEALPANGYRIRHLRDNDDHYDYSIGPERHPGGCYEIELVIEKLAVPGWAIEGNLQSRPAVRPVRPSSLNGWWRRVTQLFSR